MYGKEDDQEDGNQCHTREENLDIVEKMRA